MDVRNTFGLNTRLSGVNLWIARSLTITLVLISLLLFVFGLPYRAADLIQTTIHIQEAIDTLPTQIAPSLLASGSWVSVYVISVYVIELVLILLLTITAAIIFWRRSDDWIALFLVVGLVTYGVYVTPTLDALMAAHPQLKFIGNMFQALGVGCAIFFFYLFPNGRFVPHWTRYLGLTWIAWALVWVLFPSSGFNFSQPFAMPFVSFLLLFTWWVSGLFAQVYRYRKVSNPIERQQTKWIVYGVALAVIGYGIYGLLQSLVFVRNPSSIGSAIFQLIGVPIFLLCVFLVPLTFTFSILRYRLWDIDVIIRKTLVYGGLTATLIVIYIAIVVLLQSLVTAVGGQQSVVITAISTLAIAALFNPLRRRIQTDIDRRFYRKRYDADQIVAAFNAGLRDQVNLEQFCNRLLVVVEESLQPDSVNLWLRPNGKPVEGQVARQILKRRIEE